MAYDDLPIEEPVIPQEPEQLEEVEMETRDVRDHSNSVIGHLTLPASTTEEVWTEKLSYYSYVAPNPTMSEIVQRKIEEAKVFGQQLMDRFAKENVLMGITQAGKTIAVTDYLHKLSHYILTGSLYAAITEIDRLIDIGLDIGLSPFITDARLTIYKNDIKAYLGI